MNFRNIPTDKMMVLFAKFLANTAIAPTLAPPVVQDAVEDNVVEIEGRILRYTPTRLPLARWAKNNPEAVREGEQNFSVDDVRITRISREFSVYGLFPSPLFPQFGKCLSTDEVLQRIKTEIPVDNTEIVDWMQDSTATNVVCSAREEEYNQHSQFETSSGDGFIPGVRVRDIRFESMTGYSYANIGYATVICPAGRINIPRGRLVPLIGKDFLGWAAAGAQYGIQWKGVAAQFLSLADKITNAIGFPNVDGNIAPHFVLQQPNKQAERARVVLEIASARDQKLNITFRRTGDFREVVDEGSIDVSQGTNRLEFIVASYPSVPPLVNQMQPSCNSILRRFEVIV